MPPHLLLLCRALARAGGVAVAPVALLYLGSALAELAPKPGRMAALWQAMPEMGVSVVPLADLLAAALLVFVDVMKELPATLILRPFDFDTLASQVYTYASVGQLEEAALPALAIILVGLIPVVISLTLIDRSRRFSK